MVKEDNKQPEHDGHGRLNTGANVEQSLLECRDPGQIISPLGWSIQGRLLCAAAAAAFLWLAVAWAIGWL